MREPERWDKQDCSPRFFHACPETGNIRRHTCDGERQGNDPAMERLHIGNLIRAKLAERGRTVIWLARQMPCSRTNIYKIFDQQSIDTATLKRLSEIIGHDFFADLSDDLRHDR